MQSIKDIASGTVTYYWESALGVDTSARAWTIRKDEVIGNITTSKYPIGKRGLPSDLGEFIWDERALLNFSFVRDSVPPTLSSVGIASNNTTTTLAKVGDTITLTFVWSEVLQTPVVTIAGQTATVIRGIDDLHFTATYVMRSSNTAGTVPFVIAFKDNGGTAGVNVTATTDSSAVRFDNVVPTAYLEYSVDAGSHYASTISTKDADTLRIRATFSEVLLDAPVVKLSINNSVLPATVMTKSTTTSYYYDLNVPTGNINATCTLSVWEDLAGNVIAVTPTSGATFKIDNTPASFTFTGASSNNVNTTLSKAGDTVSVVFVSSEILASNPTVTFWTKAMTFASKNGLSYTYTRVLDGTETEGTAAIAVGGTDLAGNVTSSSSIGTFHTDFTVPTLSSAVKVSTTSITVTLSALALATSITKANNGWFAVHQTGTPGTTYAVTSIAPGATNNLVTLTVADMTASASAWVTVTYLAGANGTVYDLSGNALATDSTWVVIASW